MTKDIEVKVRNHPVFDFLVMEAVVPLDFVQSLDAEVDKVFSRKVKDDDFSDKLVGQIKTGAQLKLNREESEVFEQFHGIVESFAMKYAKFFEESISSSNQELHAAAHCNEMWSVHSFANDYNPLHDHGKLRPDTGAMSFVLWTKIPENMRNEKATSMKGASGMLDGAISFVNGPMGQGFDLELRPTKVLSIEPKVGRMVIFPSWLNHMVYPFRCEGERRSLAGNIALFSKEHLSHEKIQGDGLQPQESNTSGEPN
ncbi:MAG TPA: hypothetical protein DCW74_01490 [Alteromonas australica]|uniref:Prolyl 4-hydroxylase alpha subunit Fe(2+) 2OG dioxygenase domain-containing protein n=1 Tax=Alteromonas australica TaxID=589873 RepID=A0A350NZC2_9ALTE|nr:hypothetical protein [Alteromonas australica]|tara:strand:+ start:1982 stop:2749 length:768 start_codon:yes stop_codon:yes gene_type:complete